MKLSPGFITAFVVQRNCKRRALLTSQNRFCQHWESNPCRLRDSQLFNLLRFNSPVQLIRGGYLSTKRTSPITENMLDLSAVL